MKMQSYIASKLIVALIVRFQPDALPLLAFDLKTADFKEIMSYVQKTALASIDSESILQEMKELELDVAKGETDVP